MGYPDTFWLNVTNIGLGVITLICCLGVVYALARELMLRAKERADVAELRQMLAEAGPDDHALAVPGLGLVMADGGEKVKKGRRKRPKP